MLRLVRFLLAIFGYPLSFILMHWAVDALLKTSRNARIASEINISQTELRELNSLKLRIEIAYERACNFQDKMRCWIRFKPYLAAPDKGAE